MPKKGIDTVYISVQMTDTEKQTLDEAVAESGKTRNRFIRDWIASLADRKIRK